MQQMYGIRVTIVAEIFMAIISLGVRVTMVTEISLVIPSLAVLLTIVTSPIEIFIIILAVTSRSKIRTYDVHKLCVDKLKECHLISLYEYNYK